MLGVVLWSDSQEQKAVIWCEDHGDLAFYKRTDDGTPVALDAGDWVQFDLTTERQMRFAHNPRLVSEGRYQNIAGVVSRAGTTSGRSEPAEAKASRRGSAEILCFRREDRARKTNRALVPVHV